MNQLLQAINPRWHKLTIDDEEIDYHAARLYLNVESQAITIHVFNGPNFKAYPVQTYSEHEGHYKVILKKALQSQKM